MYHSFNPDAIYEILALVTTVTAAGLPSLLQLIDNLIFVVICQQSIYLLTWPHKNYLLYWLFGNALIIYLRWAQNSASSVTGRGIYLIILIGVMVLINRLIATLQATAIRLKPDESNPEARYTV
mgnify:CR=1 FL=1